MWCDLEMTGLDPDVSEFTEDMAFFMGPDDVMLLYSDGIVEARNSEKVQYEVTRLRETFRQAAGLSVDAIKAAILADVQAWMTAQRDDISIVVLRRQGSAVRQPEMRADVV